MDQKKKKRDPEYSREAILEAATQEFSDHGYDGARMDSIVARAKVSKNLAYHYYGGKDELFLRVMERMYAKMREHHSDLQIQDMAPVDGMRQLVIHTFEHFCQHPEVISLLNSENLYKAVHIRGTNNIAELYFPLVRIIQDLLNRGSEEGVFRNDVDPMHLYITISGLGYFYLSNQHTLGTVFRSDLVTEAQIAAREKHIVDVVLGYLRPVS
jgi:TetR/AcrR family transcriptional regulator